MNFNFLLGLNAMLLMAFYPTHILAHDEDPRVSVESEMSSVQPAGLVDYKFQLIDEKLKKEIKPENLVVTHTKLLHLISYDSARVEFFHEHPEYISGQWQAKINFKVNGSYFIFLQGQLVDGDEFSAYIKIQIINGEKENEIKSLSEVRKFQIENTAFEFESRVIKAKKMLTLNYKISRTDGKPAVVEPYLGANAHVIAVAPDADSIVHVHPMDGIDATTGMIHASFPMAGDYRVWVQIIEAKRLLTFPLAFKVVP
jgi:hypothetical protein